MYQPDKIFPLPESLPVETVREPWRQALLEAAEYMRVHGHCIGHSSDASGAVCAVGAVCFGGRPGMALTGEVLDRLRDYIGGGRWVCIPDWSDTHTAAEVIQALEGAARSALREGEMK